MSTAGSRRCSSTCRSRGASLTRPTHAGTPDRRALRRETIRAAMTDSPVSVLIVDDQAPFRLAARAVVSRTDGFEVVGEADSGEAAVDMADVVDPQLVLMDINLPGISGLEATNRIVAAHPDALVVLLSTYRAEDLPAEARSCGAGGYLHKEEFGPKALRQLWAEQGVDGWRVPG